MTCLCLRSMKHQSPALLGHVGGRSFYFRERCFASCRGTCSHKHPVFNLGDESSPASVIFLLEKQGEAADRRESFFFPLPQIQPLAVKVSLMYAILNSLHTIAQKTPACSLLLLVPLWFFEPCHQPADSRPGGPSGHSAGASLGACSPTLGCKPLWCLPFVFRGNKHAWGLILTAAGNSSF